MDREPPIPDCLASNNCPNCGYSLEGLAKSGTCPECGRRYDASVIVLYGTARGRHENLANTKPSRLLWIIFLSLLSWVWFLPQMMFAPTRYLWPLPILLLPPAYLLFRRHGSDQPGLIQVRLDPHGCVQFDDLSPSSLTHWVRAHGWLIPLIFAGGMLFSLRERWVDSLTFWIWTPVAVLAAALLWRPCAQVRAALREVRDDAILDACAAYVRPTPWKDVGYVFVHPAADGTYRLKIERRHSFLTTEPVDAEVNCTAEQAAQLEPLLKQWVELSRAESDRAAAKALIASATNR